MQLFCELRTSRFWPNFSNRTRTWQGLVRHHATFLQELVSSEGTLLRKTRRKSTIQLANTSTPEVTVCDMLPIGGVHYIHHAWSPEVNAASTQLSSPFSLMTEKGKGVVCLQHWLLGIMHSVYNALLPLNSLLGAKLHYSYICVEVCQYLQYKTVM